MADAPPGVSGPGASARRTDRSPAQKIRDLPDAQYGENATYRDLQQQAPLAQVPQAPAPRKASAGRGAGAGGPSIIPIHAPTQRPLEPVTAGAASGPGPGPEALGGPNQMAAQGYQSAAQALAAAAAVSRNPDLMWLAQRSSEGRF